MWRLETDRAGSFHVKQTYDSFQNRLRIRQNARFFPHMPTCCTNGHQVGDPEALMSAMSDMTGLTLLFGESNISHLPNLRHRMCLMTQVPISCIWLIPVLLTGP